MRIERLLAAIQAVDRVKTTVNTCTNGHTTLSDPCKICGSKSVIKEDATKAANSKYRNQKVEIDGIVFDSTVEGARYLELCDLQRIGLIWDLKTQVRFELIPATGGRRAVVYVADFTYFDKDGYQIEDVKGMLTGTYKIKAKLMAEKGHVIRVVSREDIRPMFLRLAKKIRIQNEIQAAAKAAGNGK